MNAWFLTLTWSDREAGDSPGWRPGTLPGRVVLDRVFCFGRMERKERRGCGDAQGRTGSVMAKRGEQQAIKSPVHP